MTLESGIDPRYKDAFSVHKSTMMRHHKRHHVNKTAVYVVPGQQLQYKTKMAPKGKIQILRAPEGIWD